MMNDKQPHNFCETPEEGCTMNYCDDNGCNNRKRNYVELSEQSFCKCCGHKTNTTDGKCINLNCSTHPL